MTWNIAFWKGRLHPLTNGGRLPFSSENVELHVHPPKKTKGKILVSHSALESVLNCMLMCSQFYQEKG